MPAFKEKNFKYIKNNKILLFVIEYISFILLIIEYKGGKKWNTMPENTI